MRGQWSGKWNPVAADASLSLPLSSPFSPLRCSFLTLFEKAESGVDVALRQFVWGVHKFFRCAAPFPVRDEISGKFMLLIVRTAEGERRRAPSKTRLCPSSQVKVTSHKGCEGTKERHCFPIFLPFRAKKGEKNVLRHLDKARKIETLASKGKKDSRRVWRRGRKILR